jgi:glycosyltransferase involved in cell wall biosynthesis
LNRRNIKISVIMACYNSSAYLDEAVSSILNQTFGDLELILIDDFSNDNTLEMANDYKMLDDRVTVIPLMVNSGQAFARNAGIRVARGEWLGILDSDDVAMPSRFEEQLNFAGKNNDLVLIGSNLKIIDSRSNIIKKHRYPTNHRDLTKRLDLMQAFPPHSSMIYRREVVNRLAGFNTRFKLSQDRDLWLRLAEIGKIASLDRYLVKIRKHHGNRSNLEGGMLQAHFGHAASVCHFLRIYGFPDPSSNSDEADWNIFFTWIVRRMIEEGVFEKRKARAEARAEYFAKQNQMVGAIHFGSHVLKTGYAGTLLREKLFGSSLPKKLAQEWMKRSCAAS